MSWRCGSGSGVPADEERHGNGISGTRDAVDMSVRDLALLMMQVSDNTATDTLQALVGTDRINARLQGLGLTETIVRRDCAGLIADITADLGGDVEALGEADLQSGDPLGLGPSRSRPPSRRARHWPDAPATPPPPGT